MITCTYMYTTVSMTNIKILYRVILFTTLNNKCVHVHVINIVPVKKHSFRKIDPSYLQLIYKSFSIIFSTCCICIDN